MDSLQQLQTSVQAGKVDATKYALSIQTLGSANIDAPFRPNICRASRRSEKRRNRSRSMRRIARCRRAMQGAVFYLMTDR